MLEDNSDIKLLKIDGADEAIVGVGERCGMPPTLIYDYYKLVRCLSKKNGWDDESAAEWVDYNIAGAYVGERTPIILMPFEVEFYEIN